MIWRAFHLVFGWDYIAWQNRFASGVARVRCDGIGRAYYWRCTSLSLVEFIEDPKQVVWLTCAPDKYMPTKKA